MIITTLLLLLFCMSITEPLRMVNIIFFLCHVNLDDCKYCRSNTSWGIYYWNNKHYMKSNPNVFFFSIDDRDENYILYNGDLDDTIMLCIYPK